MRWKHERGEGGNGVTALGSGCWDVVGVRHLGGGVGGNGNENMRVEDSLEPWVVECSATYFTDTLCYCKIQQHVCVQILCTPPVYGMGYCK